MLKSLTIVLEKRHCYVIYAYPGTRLLAEEGVGEGAKTMAQNIGKRKIVDRLCLFRSGIGYGFWQNYGSVSTYLSFSSKWQLERKKNMKIWNGF